MALLEHIADEHPQAVRPARGRLRGHSAVSAPPTYAALKSTGVHMSAATVEPAAVNATVSEAGMEMGNAIFNEDVMPEEDAISKENTIPEEDGVPKTMPKMVVDKKD
jgi:hypothetical protein